VMVGESLLAVRQMAIQIIRFVAYVTKRFWVFYVVIALTVVVLSLDYLATSLMIPLATGPTESSSAIMRFWISVAEILGLNSEPRTWVWFFLIILIGRLALGYILSILTTSLGKSVHESLSGKIFAHILLVEPLARVYTRTVGHYITLAGDDTFRAGTIVSSLLQAVVAFCTAMLGLLVLLQFSLTAFVSCALFLLFAGVFIAMMIRQTLRTNAQSVDLSRELGTTFVEALNGLRSIRTLHAERFVMLTYSNQIHLYIRMLVKMEALRQAARVLPALLLLLLAIVVLRPESSVSVSDAAIFAGTVIVMRIFASLGQLVSAGSQVLTEMRAVKDINALVQISQEILNENELIDTPSVHTIALQQIAFGYDTRGLVFQDINFVFQAGKTYAIIGPSGSGKSTLADIMLGLSQPSQGRVRINDSDLEQSAVRRRFALVEQQPKIFSSTIRENLLLGHHATDEEILLVLRLVSLESLVLSLPNGLATRLSYLGENFSGGQRQRLGIARALLRQPDVLILDEATSALDAVTRASVVANVRSHIKNGIVIFITHDLEIASLVDQVLRTGGE
jgi:ABC-type bacteriocin/lantibiotic exporter with double-glycine peptidase domain